MSKSDSKSRILYIYRILVEETDSEHQITIQQIIDRLDEIGISAYRKTVQADIEFLKEFGLDVVCIRSSQNRYYINSNVFTLSELKLLVDAVEASYFITQLKSAELIGKLSDLTSSNNADKLSRHIYFSKRMKSDNEEIYDVVDKIHTAINEKHQITFQYYEYDSMKNRVLRNEGNRYQFSPYGMTWEDNKYYVVGYSVKHNKIIPYRVDRMTDVIVTDNLCVPQPDGFSVADYVSRVFRMYGDEPVVAVTLKCKNRVMKSVIDRFGFDVKTTPVNKEYFTAVVDVSPSQTFFGWVFQFGGDIQIMKPAKVKRAFSDMGKRIFGDEC